MSTEHTPGPWVVEQNQTVDKGRQIAAFGTDGNRVLQIIVRSFRTERDMALVAAAPELLGALKAASNYVDALGGDSRGYRQVLAKAEGKS